MEKYIPYEKLSKKEKRKMDLAKRQTWGELNPVTRKPQNSKAYNRNKSRNWKRDYQTHQLRDFFIQISLSNQIGFQLSSLQHSSQGQQADIGITPF